MSASLSANRDCLQQYTSNGTSLLRAMSDVEQVELVILTEAGLDHELLMRACEAWRRTSLDVASNWGYIRAVCLRALAERRINRSFTTWNREIA